MEPKSSKIYFVVTATLLLLVLYGQKLIASLMFAGLSTFFVAYWIFIEVENKNSMSPSVVSWISVHLTYLFQKFYHAKLVKGKTNATGDVINVDHTNCPHFDHRRPVSTPLSTAAREEISLLMKFIHNDFVRNWYENVSDDEEFLNAIASELEGGTGIIVDSIKKINRVKTVESLILTYRSFIHEFAKSVTFVQAKSKSKIVYSEHEKIVGHFLSSAAHLNLKSKYQDEKYLLHITSLLIELIFTSKELKSCKFLSNTGFIDIIYKHLVLPLFDNVRDSDWLYEQIIFILSDDIRIQGSVSNVNTDRQYPSRNPEDTDPISEDYELDFKQLSTSLPSLSIIPSLFNERFFSQYDKCAPNSESSENILAAKTCHCNSLPDLNKLRRTSSLNFDQHFDSSESSSENSTVLFSISSCENLTKFNKDAENIKLIFSDVNIPATETHKSNGINQSYTVYCIQYHGWYMVPYSTETNDEDGGYFVVDGLKYVQKQTVAKRRFREFINLQKRLESNPLLKSHLKGVKGPNKFLSLPFSKMARQTVEQRRIFLQQYLISLCQTEHICTSTELREFMAYGTNANIAYVNKPREIPIPRLDQMVLNTFSGVFNKLLTALPSLDSQKDNQNPQHQKSGSLSLIKEMLPGIESLGFSVLHSFKAESSDFHSSVAKFIGSSESQEERFDALLNVDHQEVQKLPPPLSTCQPTQRSADGEDLPLSRAVFDLAAESFVNKKIPSCVISMLQACIGNAFEIYLKDSIDELTSEENMVRYLRKFREKFWPSGIFGYGLSVSKTEADKQVIKGEALRVLKEFFPGILPKIIGEEQYQECAEFFLESIQHPELNRILMGMMLDVILDAVITSNDIQLES